MIEWISAGLIIFFLVRLANFVANNGYLPAPFFHNVNDTLMDWYNTVFWAQNHAEYSIWQSVYPPLPFVIIRILSIKSCYGLDPLIARDCDHFGVWVMIIQFTINIPIIFYIYRQYLKRMAWPRTVAMALGMPMLYTLERGNLLIIAFMFFVLGHSRVIKSARWKWLMLAFSINIKPYLVVSLLPYLLRRKWRWLEGCAIATLIVYVISFIINGDGNPVQIVQNIIIFGAQAEKNYFDGASYSPSYSEVIGLLKSDFPLMTFVGSTPLELMEFWLPLVIRTGQFVSICALAAASFRPAANPTFRLAALTLAMLLTSTDPGGYTVIFLIFLVFLERKRSAPLFIVLISAYLVSIPWDYAIVTVSKETGFSWISGRVVGYDLAVHVGELVRPGLILLIEGGLAFEIIWNVVRAWRDGRQEIHHGQAPAQGLLPGSV